MSKKIYITSDWGLCLQSSTLKNYRPMLVQVDTVASKNTLISAVPLLLAFASQGVHNAQHLHNT